METLAVYQLKKRRIQQEKLRKEQELRDMLTVKEEDVDPAAINKLFGLPEPPSEIFALGRDSSCALWWTYDKEMLTADDEILDNTKLTLDSESTKVAPPEPESSPPADNSSRHRASLGDITTSTRGSVRISKRKLRKMEEENLLRKKLQEEKEEREIQEILSKSKNKDNLKVTGWEILRYRKDPVKDLSLLSPEDSALVSFNTVTGYGIWRLKGSIKISKASQTQIIIENLTNNYEYYFQICAVNKKGIGLPSVASNVIFVEKELPVNWYRYFDRKVNKIFYTSIKSNRIYYETRPEEDPFFLHDDLYLQFINVDNTEEDQEDGDPLEEDGEEDTAESECSDPHLSYESPSHRFSEEYSMAASSKKSKRDQKRQANNEKELNLLKSLFNEEMMMSNGVITCDKMMALLNNELYYEDIPTKYLLELFYIYNKFNNKNFYFQKFAANTSAVNKSNTFSYYDNLAVQKDSPLTRRDGTFYMNKPDFTIITTWIEFVEIVLQVKIRYKELQRGKNRGLGYYIKRSLLQFYNSKNLVSLPQLNVFMLLYMKYQQFYLHSNILMYDNEEKYGNWVKKFNNFIGKTYYENVLSGEILWYLPNEIRFFLPKNLERMLLKKFNYGQLNEFKKYFIIFDIDNNGDLSFDEVKILFQKFIFKPENLVKKDQEPEEDQLDAKPEKTGFFSKLLSRKKKKKITDGSIISDEELKQLIKTVDMNNNGTIEFNEFCWMLHEIASKNEFIFNWEQDAENGETIPTAQTGLEDPQPKSSEMEDSPSEKLESSIKLLGEIGEKISHASAPPLLPIMNSTALQTHLDPVVDHGKRRKSFLARSSSSSNHNTPRRGSVTSVLSSSSSNSGSEQVAETTDPPQLPMRRRSLIGSLLGSREPPALIPETSVEASSSAITAKNRKKLIPLFNANASIAPEIQSFPHILDNINNPGLGFTRLPSIEDKLDEDGNPLSAIYEESSVATGEYPASERSKNSKSSYS